MKLTINFLLCLLMLISYSACQAQTNQSDNPPPPSNEYFPQKWFEYVSDSGKFKIKFPKKPNESSQIQNGIGGESTVYISEYKGLLLYVTTYADSAGHIPDAKAFLNGISDAWLNANSGRNPQVIKNEEISFNGNPARFLQIETRNDVVRVRWIVVKDRVYYQFVAAPKHKNAMDSENGYEKLAMAFLDSFELVASEQKKP
jgi:hypothetical protein